MRKVLAIFFLFGLTSVGFAQDKCMKSTEGDDFWFGFMEGRWYNYPNHYIQITVTSIHYCKIDVFIGKSTTPSFSRSIKPNVPDTITITPYSLAEPIGSEIIQEKAIHLVSDSLLNLYALNWSKNSSEVALIYPTASLGKEYYAMCYTPHIQGNGYNTGNGRNSEFVVVASQDNTTVNITPSKVTDKGIAGGSLIRVNLDKGELYQVQSENLPKSNLSGQGDLTGSYLTSDKPVAVFAGSLSTTVPGDSTVSAWDHLYEQMPPVQAWGTTFIAVPLLNRQKDTYRILASQPNTYVQIGNNPSTPLTVGIPFEFMLSYDQPSLIKSDKPILVAQYSNSNNVDAAYNKGDGDPFEIIVSPVNQTREEVAFVAYDSPEITSKFYINVVVRDDAVGKILLDNAVVPFTALSGTGYSYAQRPILVKGTHVIKTTEPGKGFTAYVYAFGGVEGYGYGVGYSLDLMLDLGGHLDKEGEKYIVRCDQSAPITLKAGNAFDSFLWSTGETSSSIDVTDEGMYTVKASTREGCSLSDTIRLVVSKPAIHLGNDTTLCNPNKLLLDAGVKGEFDENDKATDFQWTIPGNTVSGQQVTSYLPGYYIVVATTTNRCIASDQIKVSFTNRPVLDVTKLDTLICGQKSVILNISADKGNYALERSDNTETFSDLHAAVPQFGTYPFKFTAVDQYGCSTDTTFKLGFHKIPAVSFSIDSTKCYHYNLSASYVGDAAVDASPFVWVFGGDTIADGKGITTNIIPLGVNQNKRDLSLSVTDQGCTESFTIPNIKVIPNMQVHVVDSLGCEPFKAEFKAENSEKVTYDWDYGDNSTGHTIDSHTFHTYQQDGFYKLKLKITTDNGCTNSVSVDSIVHVAPIPTVGFSLDPSLCLDKKNNQVSYIGSSDQKDTYNWDLSAFDASEIIQNPGKTQGPFTFNLINKPKAPIGLQVISKYGCVSQVGKMELKRKPSFSFAVTGNKGCLPLESNFSAIAGDPVDKINYTWNFGEGAAGSGTTTSHLYTESNRRYDVTLTGVSETTSCSDILTQDTLIFVYPKPRAEFSLDHSIVYNDKPDVMFENQSREAESFLWDFGEGSTSTDVNPSHKYKSHGYHKVLLEAFNDFECSDTISHQVLVALSQIFPPNAFSPNAPNEVDREFKLAQEAIREEGYHLVIFSRWDDIVFEIKNEVKGWDGRMKNGEYAPAGSYVWKLDFVDFLGRSHHQTGSVTLIY
jgi:hypothetical protein